MGLREPLAVILSRPTDDSLNQTKDIQRLLCEFKNIFQEDDAIKLAVEFYNIHSKA